MSFGVAQRGYGEDLRRAHRERGYGIEWSCKLCDAMASPRDESSAESSNGVALSYYARRRKSKAVMGKGRVSWARKRKSKEMHIKATEKQRNVIRSVAMAKDGDDGNTWSAEIAKAKTAEPYPAKETNCLVSTAEAKQRSELRWNSKAGIALQWRGAESRTTQWHSKSWFGEAKAKSIKAQFSSAERR